MSALYSRERELRSRRRRETLAWSEHRLAGCASRELAAETISAASCTQTGI